MADISVQTIHDILVADSTVMGLLGSDRVYPLIRPQSMPLPSVSLQRILSIPQNTLAGDSGLRQTRLQLDAWHTTYADARTLSDACGAAINAAGHILERELDNFSDSAELSGVYRITQEYSVWL